MALATAGSERHSVTWGVQVLKVNGDSPVSWLWVRVWKPDDNPKALCGWSI